VSGEVTAGKLIITQHWQWQQWGDPGMGRKRIRTHLIRVMKSFISKNITQKARCKS